MQESSHRETELQQRWIIISHYSRDINWCDGCCVLVSNVVNRNRPWDKAIEELENFWTLKYGLSSNPDFSKWWRNDDYGQNKAYASMRL